MSLLQLKEIHKSFGSKLLFKNETLSINSAEHIGVIGPNGAGKSTLFRVVIGDEKLDSGTIVRSKQLRLGYLPQHDLWKPEETIETFVMAKATIPIWEAKQLGLGLGLKEDDFQSPIQSFSGGYRMRVKLLAMLASEPNLMLLDEPTNYLDLETLLVLENFLNSFDGAILLISHDREFLKKVGNHIIEIDNGQIVKFSGGLDSYEEQKKLWKEEKEKKAQSIADEKKEILDFAARFRAQATKARQVQSRLKRLDKLEEEEDRLGLGSQNSSKQKATIKIPKPIHTGKTSITVKNASFGYPDGDSTKIILKPFEFIIRRGDHVGVVGVNGAGKTTLLKGLSQTLKPLSGDVSWGYEVSLGYYAQHVVEGLNLKHNVFESLQTEAHPDILPQEIKDIAGAFLFSGTDIEKPLRVLSGGELARVALARILLKKAPCLVLDEPTNHLDFQTVDSLTEALKNYPGTVIIVSHDRDFISRSTTQIIEVRDGTVAQYRGTYSEYLWSLSHGGLTGLSSQGIPPTTNRSPNVHANNGNKKNSWERKKEINRDIRKLKKEISGCEKKIETIQKTIEKKSSELQSLDGEKLNETSQEIGALQWSVIQEEEVWDKKTTRLSKLEEELDQFH